LRIGWLVGPAEVVARLALVKQASDIQAPTINQKVIARVAPEIAESQAEKVRPIYRRRRDAMLSALRAHMPEGVSWTEPQGGFFVWVTLPAKIDAKALLARALATVKTAFVPGAAFFPDRSGANTLRLSFSLGEPAIIEEGVARLARVVREAA
jgi:DNA-binding transcriptional MocR family regulator